jgi:hypothetical protein
MDSEAQIQSEIHRALGSKPNIRIFRNHVGAVRDERGRVHSFGLQKGSGDLIGWVSLEITPAMVGQTVAVFLSVEVKSATGRTRPEQETWARIVNAKGGIALVARSVADAENQLNERHRK